jgi:hypothetical protein
MQQKKSFAYFTAIFDRSRQNTKLKFDEGLRFIYSNCAACFMIFLLHCINWATIGPVWRDNPILILGW